MRAGRNGVRVFCAPDLVTTATVAAWLELALLSPTLPGWPGAGTPVRPAAIEMQRQTAGLAMSCLVPARWPPLWLFCFGLHYAPQTCAKPINAAFILVYNIPILTHHVHSALEKAVEGHNTARHCQVRFSSIRFRSAGDCASSRRLVNTTPVPSRRSPRHDLVFPGALPSAKPL